MDGTSICEQLETRVSRNGPFAGILEHAVRLIHGSREEFHWTGIYELFPDGTLRLGPFLGTTTDHVFIGIEEGVCGTALARGRNMNIPDVTKIGNYLARRAKTRSELVVLIRTGDRIHAQIDIDSHNVAAFDERVEREVQKVADYLADQYDRRSRSRAA